MKKLLALFTGALLAGCAAHHPNKHHLSNLELYRMGMPSAARFQAIGRFVTLDVKVLIQRDVPLVEIPVPTGLPVRHADAIPAHLLHGYSYLKPGERWKINGLIVDEGYGAYFIYVHGFPEKLESHPLEDVAAELRKVLQPFWNVTSSNNIIRIESQQDVWLLYPSLPPKEPGESEDHYARKTGFKTKYDVKLTFVPRLSKAQLDQIREKRQPLERALKERANDKRKFSETVNALEKIPLPAWYSDDYSVFMESPYGAAGVYPPEAADRAEQVMGALRKLFDRTHIKPIVAQSLVSDPVKAIQDVLPSTWVILKVETNTYPSYRPEGKGTAVFLAIRDNKYFKQEFSAALYIMPADYKDGGEDPTHGQAQSGPPRHVATTKNAKIYLWPSSEAGDWQTMEEDLLKALLK